MDVDARYALGAGDRERVRCDAVRLQARLRVHIHLQSLPGVSLTVCDRAEAGGMSRLPQCRPVAVHIPVTRQRSGQCTGAPRRVPGATARRVYHEVQYTRVHQSVTNANGNIKVLASVKYLRLSKSADVGRLSTKPAGALHGLLIVHLGSVNLVTDPS